MPSSWCSPYRPRRCARTSSAWADVIPQDAVLVSLMKGVELGTLKRMSEVIAEVTGAGPERIAVVSGPNLAARSRSASPPRRVIACADESVAKRLQDAVHSQAFRPYRSTDVLGLRARRRLQERRRPLRRAWRSGSASATTPRRR